MPELSLYYVHDPMCSWCYAFKQSLSELQKDLPAEISLVYVLGGLAADTDDPMPVTMQNIIQHAWQRIERTVPNIRFNYDFWTFNTATRSTYPACRALLAARKQGANFEAELLQAIQQAYYQQAKNPSLTVTLEQCATEVGLDKVGFIKDLTSQEIEHQLQAEIQLARTMGVSSYPSLLLLLDQQPRVITIDYLNHQPMLEQISAIMLAKSK